jgi:ribosomal-protein-serine acetyltransferase
LTPLIGQLRIQLLINITFAIVRDGRVAGGCGLHRRGGPNTLEIGYWTHPAFLRLGVARTAARLLTELAFTVPGIERVEIHHDKANQASAGVPRSLGYRPIREQPGTPSAPAEHGIDCTWRVTRDEWLNAR